MTNDDGRKPEGAPERSPKADVGGPFGRRREWPQALFGSTQDGGCRATVARRAAGRARTRLSVPVTEVLSCRMLSELPNTPSSPSWQTRARTLSRRPVRDCWLKRRFEDRLQDLEHRRLNHPIASNTTPPPGRHQLERVVTINRWAKFSSQSQFLKPFASHCRAISCAWKTCARVRRRVTPSRFLMASLPFSSLDCDAARLNHI
jgi:hypothetical protein